MTEKTLITSYVSAEAERLNKALKEMVDSGHVPTEAEKDALLADMESTLAKLTTALERLTQNMNEEEEDPVA